MDTVSIVMSATQNDARVRKVFTNIEHAQKFADEMNKLGARGFHYVVVHEIEKIR